MRRRRVLISMVFVALAASGVHGTVNEAEPGCGTLYDTWRDFGEPVVRQYGHGTDTPMGWNTQIGFANMSLAHSHVQGSQTLDHTWGWGWSHNICN